MPEKSGKTKFQSYPIRSFSAGINTDSATSEANELLQAINVVLLQRGGFEKRKGTELLTEAGISIDALRDIYGFALYAYDSVNDCWYVGSIFESTKGTLDTIVLVNFGDDNYDVVETVYDAWVAAAIAGGYNGNYTYAFDNDCGGGGG